MNTLRFKPFILITECIRCEIIPLQILTDFRAHLKLGENKRYAPFKVKLLFYLCGETYLSRSQQLLLVLYEEAPWVNLVSAQRWKLDPGYNFPKLFAKGTAKSNGGYHTNCIPVFNTEQEN